MKQITILIVLVLAQSFTHAQSSQKGIAMYEYQIPNEKLLIKEAALEFDEDETLFSYNRTEPTQNPKDNGITNSDNKVNVSISTADEQGFATYRNFSKKEIVNRSPKIGKLFDAFTYDDEWISFNWKITDQFKKIGKFNAQKAIGKFRGRVYIAWFTEEIPLPYGPWKLFGLPGLIIEAEDQEQMFKAKLLSIKYPCECNIAVEKPSALENKTLRQYVEFRENIHRMIFEKMRARLPRDKANSMRFMPTKDEGRKYWDERIFEWEVKEQKKNSP